MMALLLAARVVYATAQTAYLDAGAAEGLARGAVLKLSRGGACRVEAIADHHASCAAQGARAGESFALPPAPSREPPPKRLQPLAAKEIAQRAATISSASLPLVEFAAEPGMVRRPSIEARAKQLIFASSEAKPWAQQRLDVRARGVPLVADVTLAADLSARYWSARAAPVTFRPDDRAQLYVREAALRRDAPGLAFALGRIRPAFAPGITPLDGAQAGWKTRAGDEAGLFGGAVPDLETTAPSTSSGTAGAYWHVQHAGEVFVRHEARVAITSGRVEGEAVGQLGLGRALDVAADIRGGAGDRAGLDAARFDLYARPAGSLTLGGSFRYLGFSLVDGGASRHGDAFVSWDAAGWLALSARAGGDEDLVSADSRSWAGPEISLSGNTVGAAAGWQLERGFDRGGFGWLQANLHGRAFRLSATGTWSRTRDGDLSGDEFGLAVGAAADLSRNLTARLSLLSRLGGKSGPLDTGLAGGASGSAEIAGKF